MDWNLLSQIVTIGAILAGGIWWALSQAVKLGERRVKDLQVVREVEMLSKNVVALSKNVELLTVRVDDHIDSDNKRFAQFQTEISKAAAERNEQTKMLHRIEARTRRDGMDLEP